MPIGYVQKHHLDLALCFDTQKSDEQTCTVKDATFEFFPESVVKCA